MTEYQEKVMLARHGTVDVELPATAILAVAREDFARRQRNRKRADGHRGAAEVGYERYAFLIAHVRNAKSAADILRSALRRAQKIPKDGDDSTVTKLSALRLTASLENLALAIQLAEKENGAIGNI